MAESGARAMSSDTNLLIAVFLSIGACYFMYYLFLQQMDDLKTIQRKAVEGVLREKMSKNGNFIDFYDAIDFARQKSIYFLLPPTRSSRQLFYSFVLYFTVSVLLGIYDFTPLQPIFFIKNILWVSYSIALGAFLVLFFIDVRFAVGFRKLDKEYRESDSIPLVVRLDRE